MADGCCLYDESISTTHISSTFELINRPRPIPKQRTNERGLHSTVIGRAAGHIELSVSLGSFLDALGLAAGVVVDTKDRCEEGDDEHAHGAERRRLGRLRIIESTDEEGLCR